MKLKSIVLVSPISSSGDISNLGTAAYKDAGNSAGNVPVIMSNGKLDSSILPQLQITNVHTADSEEAMLELPASPGDICIRTDEGKTYVLTADPASTLSNWTEITLAGSVESVNNKTGIVTLSAADVGAVATNDAITGDTKCKITYDSKGLVTAGADLEASDLPAHEHAASDITSGVISVAQGGTGATDATGARTNLSVYSKAETDALIPTDLSQLSNTTTNYINNTQLQDALHNMGDIFTLKGSVSTYSALPDSDNQLGDVYYVVDEGKSYVWLYDGSVNKWEELGSSIDTSDCVKKAELLGSTGNATDNTMTQLAITTALNNKANASDIPDQLTDLDGVLPVSKGGTGTTSLTSGSFIIGNGTSAVTTLSVVPISKGGTGATSAQQARANLAVYAKSSLYYNSSGTSGTINLSSSVNSFNWIEIHYGWGDINSSTLILPNTSGTRIADLALSYTTSSGNQLLVRSTLVYINGSTITWNRNRSTLFNIGSNSYTNNDKILIRAVYGYKS